MKSFSLAGCLVLLTAMAAHAQPPIISPARSIDWSGAGVVDGIPDRTSICATLSPGVAADDITAAIAACPPGQVVKLNPGTYNLLTGVRFNGTNNVTLRGSGPDKTLLKFATSDPCMGQGGDICVNGTTLSYYIGDPTYVADWTAGYAKGNTQLTLSDTTGLSVGMFIVLDQLNDESDTGGVLVCSVPSTCADEGPGDAGRPNREQEQFVRVVAINGNTVTITPGLHMPNWRSSQSPQAFWGLPSSTISGAGVEDLSLDHTDAVDGKSGIYFIFAFNSWVRNVKSVRANRNHVWLYESAHITIRDSYFYATQNAASESYGIEEYMTSDNLIENNILHHIAVPMQTNSGSGSVFGYNYSFDDFYEVSPTWQQASSYLHGAGTDMVLHEGNEGTGLDGDDVHGSHNFVTAFRNYYIGWEQGKFEQTNPIKLYTFNRYMNVVGNVLGKVGYHNNYQWNVSGLGEETSIYSLGSATLDSPADLLVATTLLRWGNYDTVTGLSRFVATEVPSGIGLFANPVPNNRNLPASMYHQGKPNWWGSNRWPAIGPDVSGGFGPGGHVYRNPAHVCYDSTPQSDGILNFNADNCYPSHGPLSVPTKPNNVRLIR